MKFTFLYIKKHRITGMKYFGKTTESDVQSYLGSGKYWKRHIQKYGKEHVETIWISHPFTDKKDIEEFATLFSNHWNIVESNDWANLKLENGIDGGYCGGMNGKKHTTETINKMKKPKPIRTETHSKKISVSKTGKPRSKIHTENIIKKISKCWLVIDPTGQQREVINLKLFCRENNLFYGSIYGGKTNRGKNAGWEFIKKL